MIKVFVQKLKCKRCGYEWIPRTEDVRRCPKCGTVYWDREREKKERGKE